MPGDLLGCASLSKSKISELLRPTRVAELALEANIVQPLSVSVEFILSPNSTHPPWVLPQQVCVSVSADFTLPISPSPQKQQETAAHQQKLLCCISLWSPDTCSSTAQCKGDPYMCVASKDSFTTWPFMCLL